MRCNFENYIRPGVSYLRCYGRVRFRRVIKGQLTRCVSWKGTCFLAFDICRYLLVKAFPPFYDTLSCPILPCPSLPCPALLYPILSYPTLSYSILSCSVLSCPILSYHTLLFPALFRFTLPALPYPALPYRTLPCFALSSTNNSCLFRPNNPFR